VAFFIFTVMYSPIGIFDSGVGGSSILKEIHNLLPHEDIIYLADSINAPYGDKTPETILQFSIKNTEYLLEQSCKIIVVACNTATTNAISHLRTHYKVPFVGIEPAIKPAALNTQTQSIGILATKGTLSSSLFHKTSDLFAKNVRVSEQIGEGIVGLIENGQLESKEMKDLLIRYTKPMLEAKIDHLVLGCTHYAYLIPLLQSILPEHVVIIDSGAAVARQTKNLLELNGILRDSTEPGKVKLFTNGDPGIIDQITGHKFKVAKADF